MSAHRLDAEAVAAAALAIAGRGDLINPTAVLSELGHGSMTTVSKHLKAWAAVTMPIMAGRATAPNWTARELEGMALVRKVFREEAAGALADERAATDEHVRVARETANAAQEQAHKADAARQRAEERAVGLETGMAALQEQLTVANRAAAEKDAQIARLQDAGVEERRQYEQTVGDLRQSVADAEARYRGMEKHMLGQIDQARTSFAEAKKRLDDDLAMANARFARASTDLDRVRGEREVFEARAMTAEAELREVRLARGAAEQRAVAAEERVAALTAQVGQLAEQMAARVAARGSAKTKGKPRTRPGPSTTEDLKSKDPLL